jgi:hypothetical protein
VLLGFVGPKAEAEEIKHKLGEFLQDSLKLELSQEKTLITHATTQAAHFLGYDIVTQQANTRHGPNGHRTVNGKIALRIGVRVVEKLCARYLREGKPAHCNQLLHEDDFSIIAQYGAEYRGIIQYYLLAQNVGWLWKLHWVMKTSLFRTLAAKHKTTLMAMADKYTTTIPSKHGTIQCVQMVVERDGKKPLVAQFGGIHLRPDKTATITDQNLNVFVNGNRSELIQRLLADKCEQCGSEEKVEVHHIHRLADLKHNGRKPLSDWDEQMIIRRRKTLAVCSQCHHAIHAGASLPKKTRLE